MLTVPLSNICGLQDVIWLHWAQFPLSESKADRSIAKDYGDSKLNCSSNINIIIYKLQCIINIINSKKFKKLTCEYWNNIMYSTSWKVVYQHFPKRKKKNRICLKSTKYYVQTEDINSSYTFFSVMSCRTLLYTVIAAIINKLTEEKNESILWLLMEYPEPDSD